MAIRFKVTDIIDANAISQENTWRDLKNAILNIRNSNEGKIVIDFSSVRVRVITSSDSIIDILRIKNIVLLFTNDADSVDTLRVMCLGEMINYNNIINIQYKIDRELTKEEVRARRNINELEKYFVLKNNEYYFKLADVYKQIQNYDTANQIGAVIEHIYKETKDGATEIKKSSFGNDVQFQILGHQNDCKVDFDSEGNIVGSPMYGAPEHVDDQYTKELKDRLALLK